MSRLHIKPLRTHVVDPVTRRALPEGGALVEDSAYWRRRLRDGDVALVEPAKAAPKPEKKKD